MKFYYNKIKISTSLSQKIQKKVFEIIRKLYQLVGTERPERKNFSGGEIFNDGEVLLDCLWRDSSIKQSLQLELTAAS